MLFKILETDKKFFQKLAEMSFNGSLKRIPPL